MIRFIPIILGIFVAFEIVLTNQLAGSGKQVRSIDMEIDALRDENSLLTQKVASASSLATISTKAKEMGFVEPVKTQFLTLFPELPVALHSSR